MSLFNSSQFNDILFDEISLDSPPPNTIITASVVINCGSSVDINFDNLFYGQATILTSTNLSVRSKRFVGFTPTIINTESSLNPNLSARYRNQVTITGSSELFIGTLGRVRIDTSSSLSVSTTIDYAAGPITIDTSSIFYANNRVDAVAITDITGLATLEIHSSNDLVATPFEITGETTLFVDPDDPYKRLQADITGDSELLINSSIIQGADSVIIESGTTPVINAHYLASASAVINTESNFLSLKWASVDITGNHTTLTVNAQAPDQLRELGSRRRVSFVFEVDNGRTNSSILDEHYKIFRFYNSLININQTLDYVRRVASREMKSYNIDSTSHTAWSSNDSTSNLKTGQRGIVQKGATGMFFGKDGYFAIYRGPEVIDGILQIED